MVEELKFKFEKPLFNVGKLYKEEQTVYAWNPFYLTGKKRLTINKLKMKFSSENDYTES
jgi:hypothetical protein